MIDKLPLDIFDYIAMKDERLYYRLMLSFPTFARVNMKRLDWWMNLFGVKKVLSTTPTTHMTSNKIWKEEWDKLNLELKNNAECYYINYSLDITEYTWEKDNRLHRENGPAYICSVLVKEPINKIIHGKYKCVFWADEGSVDREEGFSRYIKKWDMIGDLILHVEHGGWRDEYGIDPHLIQARKEFIGLEWVYKIYWRSDAGLSEFKFSRNCWHINNVFSSVWMQTKFANVSNILGWKAYLRNVTTTKTLFKRLTET